MKTKRPYVKKTKYQVISLLMCLIVLTSFSAAFADPLSPVTVPSTGMNLPVHNTYQDGMFRDVAVKDWFKPYVESVYEYGLMKGKFDSKKNITYFDPNGKVTMGEVIAAAVNLYNLYYTGNTAYETFYQKPWYHYYVEFAYQNKLIDTYYYNYDMTKEATRGHVANIFANILPEKEYEVINRVNDNKIPDVTVDMFYGQSVYKLYRAGIVTGNDLVGTYYPSSNITRAEIAAMITKITDAKLRGRINLE